MSRESAHNALFQVIKTGCPSFRTVTRRLQHWTKVPPTDMPYLAMVQRHQLSKQQNNLPYRWVLNVAVYIYCYEEDQNQYPSTQLNNLLDELELVLTAVPPGNRLTLGMPDVEACRIEGEIELDEGILNDGNLAVAIVPIVMLAGPFSGSTS